MSGPATVPTGSTLTDLVMERRIIVCCGSGGVGKTTTAAAFALEAARRGRRACVITIDPARRLANSLGLDSLTNVPSAIPGPWPGELYAMMLDPKGTFDDLIHRYAETDEQAEGILSNRIYRSLTGALSGTQEYMAMEKLHELVETHAFDLVVVDTPPSRNALDFLDAPRRLTHFLGNRLFQVLMAPTRASLRVMGVAAHALLRTLSKVAGADIVQDAVTFFQAFAGMEEGFRERATRVQALLTDPSTSFVLVASPRSDSIAEAMHFAGKLGAVGMRTDVLIVNRVHPRFATPDVLARLPEPPAGADGAALAGLEEILVRYAAINEREARAVDGLVAFVDPAPVVRVPTLGSDVHDLTSLEAIAGLLFGPPSGPPSGPPDGPDAPAAPGAGGSGAPETGGSDADPAPGPEKLAAPAR